MKLADRLKTQLNVITPKKVYNLMVDRFQFSMGHSVLRGLPAKINVESGNLCNLRCPLCPTGQGDTSAKKGLMPFETFRKVVDELGNCLMLIRLYNWGEPLLNPELTRMIKYASSRGIYVKISTNLSLPMDTDKVDELLKSGLGKIYVSCNSTSPETYPIYHVGGDYRMVMDNIRLLAERKRALAVPTELVWLFHVARHNEHELNKARQRARELGVKLDVKRLRTDMGKEIFERAEESILRDGHWLPTNPEYNIFDMTSKQPKAHFRCNFLWEETVINWDGSVLPCCAVYNEGYAFGNILERPFREIWNNEMYVSARKEILNQSNSRSTICHVCKKNGFLKA